LAGLVAVAAFMLIGAVPASAHSELDRSDPPNGGVVPVGRTAMRLWFTEEVNAAAGAFELRTEDGTPVAVEAVSAGSDGYVDLVTEPLARDIYVLDWRVLSAEDGHPSHGQVLFGAGTRPSAVPSSGGQLPDASELVVRWLDLGAFVLAVGALAVASGVLAGASTLWSGARRRTRRLGATAVVALAVTGVLPPLMRTYPPGAGLAEWWAELWGTMTGTPWGQLWLAREVAVLAACVALLVWATRPDRRAVAARVGAVALVSVAVLEARAGHVSTLAGGAFVATAASAGHLLAAGVWAGGLVVLLLFVVPAMGHPGETRREGLALIGRGFSPMAAVASVVLLATGLYQAGRHIPDLRSLTSTVYGAAVSGKTLLVVAGLALAGLNTLVVNPELAVRVGRVVRRPSWTASLPGRFRILVAAEAVVLTAAVAVAAIATTVPSSREVSAADRATAPQHATVDGLFLTVEQEPAGPGKSRMVVRVRSTVLPAPAPVEGVDVQMVGPGDSSSRFDLDRVEQGRYEQISRSPGAGRWTAWVAVRRPGLPDAVAEVHWTVAAAGVDEATPLRTATTGLAALLVAALGTGTGLAARRRRRVSVDPAGTREDVRIR
jgi:putative copper export protein/methionine-rich copper-binding protein CopC